ncbi:MAG: dTDP-glucose 4,6-dehydratase [Terriglobia bacterium]
MRVLVTGGAGFCGSNFIRYVLTEHADIAVVNFDKLTYAGNLENLADINDDPRFRSRYRFLRGDIADAEVLEELFEESFDAVINIAAESHVDRSLENAEPFLRTNYLGTHTLLEAARRHRIGRFVHISTDEVYGPAPPGVCFREDAPLHPRNPYAASKAAADLLVLAHVHSYALPAVIVRSSNNYGPYQFPEKLIPLVIANALENKPLPLYGDGLHEREWLYVEDACRAITLLLERGVPGEIYNVSGATQYTNLAVVHAILAQLDKPRSLIRFVEDRPGHDRRYALDSSKIRALGWAPQHDFEAGLRQTIAWYRSHSEWLTRARSGEYRNYYERHYERRTETLKKLGGHR